MEKIKGRFKKIISSIWFWLLVVIVFILRRTIIAYPFEIVFLIVIILIGVSIIKRIQKSSIGDYWKISWTIIGIILIIAFTFFYIKDNLTVFDDRIGDLDNAKEIKSQIKYLKSYYDYEVLYFSYFNHSDIRERLNSSDSVISDVAFLKMKSLGNRFDQVWKGLFSLHRVYPNVPKYSILIIESTKECLYSIDGEAYRNSTNSYNYIDSQIRESNIYCS